MTGTYDTEPPRPHPNCRCVIVQQESAGYHRVEVYWDLDRSTVHRDRSPWVVVHAFHVVVFCCSGLAGQYPVLETDVTVERDWGSDETADELNARIDAAIDEAIHTLTAQCPECEQLI